MNNHCPFARLNRRHFLGASAAALPMDLGLSLSFAQGCQAAAIPGSVAHHGGDVKTLSKTAAPGLYPGQVVEARNPAMCKSGIRDAGAIRSTLDKGMKELTGT